MPSAANIDRRILTFVTHKSRGRSITAHRIIVDAGPPSRMKRGVGLATNRWSHRRERGDKLSRPTASRSHWWQSETVVVVFAADDLEDGGADVFEKSHSSNLVR